MNEKIDAIGILVTKLFASKGKQVFDGLLEVWVEALMAYDLKDLDTAFKMAIRSPDDWLNVGKIVTLLEPDVEQEALEQFTKIKKRLIRYVDNGKKENQRTWSDRAYRALLQIDGINRVYDATDKNIDFVRRDFVDAYKRAKTDDERIAIADSPTAAMIFGQVKRLN